MGGRRGYARRQSDGQASVDAHRAIDIAGDRDADLRMSADLLDVRADARPRRLHCLFGRRVVAWSVVDGLAVIAEPGFDARVAGTGFGNSVGRDRRREGQTTVRGRLLEQVREGAAVLGKQGALVGDAIGISHACAQLCAPRPRRTACQAASDALESIQHKNYRKPT